MKGPAFQIRKGEDKVVISLKHIKKLSRIAHLESESLSVVYDGKENCRIDKFKNVWTIKHIPPQKELCVGPTSSFFADENPKKSIENVRMIRFFKTWSSLHSYYLNSKVPMKVMFAKEEPFNLKNFVRKLKKTDSSSNVMLQASLQNKMILVCSCTANYSVLKQLHETFQVTEFKFATTGRIMLSRIPSFNTIVIRPSIMDEFQSLKIEVIEIMVDITTEKESGIREILDGSVFPIILAFFVWTHLKGDPKALPGAYLIHPLQVVPMLYGVNDIPFHWDLTDELQYELGLLHHLFQGNTSAKTIYAYLILSYPIRSTADEDDTTGQTPLYISIYRRVIALAELSLVRLRPFTYFERLKDYHAGTHIDWALVESLTPYSITNLVHPDMIKGVSPRLNYVNEQIQTAVEKEKTSLSYHWSLNYGCAYSKHLKPQTKCDLMVRELDIGGHLYKLKEGESVELACKRTVAVLRKTFNIATFAEKMNASEIQSSENSIHSNMECGVSSKNQNKAPEEDLLKPSLHVDINVTNESIEDIRRLLIVKRSIDEMQRWATKESLRIFHDCVKIRKYQ